MREHAWSADLKKKGAVGVGRSSSPYSVDSSRFPVKNSVRKTWTVGIINASRSATKDPAVLANEESTE